jgi:hypothetical protein
MADSGRREPQASKKKREFEPVPLAPRKKQKRAASVREASAPQKRSEASEARSKRFALL